MEQSSVDNVAIYASSTLRLYANCKRPSTSRESIVTVCFQYKLEDPGVHAIGFAEEFFHKHQLDAIFVNCCSNEWWQYPDLPAALTALRRFAFPWHRRVTYGSSMGGYAALRFAQTLGATASIAVSPQYSPRSGVIPGETRYDACIVGTQFMHEEAYMISRHVHNAILYDPLCREDRPHIARYRADAPIVPIAIPAGGHTPSILLQQCGLLTECISALLVGTFDGSVLRSQVRLRRRCSSEYWMTLIEELLIHRHDRFAARVARGALAAFPHLQVTEAFARRGRIRDDPH